MKNKRKNCYHRGQEVIIRWRKPNGRFKCFRNEWQEDEGKVERLNHNFVYVLTIFGRLVFDCNTNNLTTDYAKSFIKRSNSYQPKEIEYEATIRPKNEF